MALASSGVAQEPADAAESESAPTENAESTRGAAEHDAASHDAPADAETNEGGSAVEEDRAAAESEEVNVRDEADAQARRMFVAGRQAFHEGDYTQALAFWERSFSLSLRPGLLVGIADAHERLGQRREAAQALRHYLVLQPDSDIADELPLRIEGLELDAVDELRLPGTEESEVRHRRRFTWVAAGGAAVATIAGGIFWARARSRYDGLLATCGATSAGCAPSQVDRVSTDVALTNGSFITAGVLALSATLLYFLEAPEGGQ